MTRDEFLSYAGPPLLDGDDRVLRAAARKNVRQRGVESTLIGLAVMGSTPGFSTRQYLSLIAGTAEQMIRDEKAEKKRNG